MILTNFKENLSAKCVREKKTKWKLSEFKLVVKKQGLEERKTKKFQGKTDKLPMKREKR